MSSWKDYAKLDVLNMKGEAKNYGVYPESINEKDGSLFFLAKDETSKFLVVIGDAAAKFEGTEEDGAKVCPISVANYKALAEFFPFIKPVNHKDHPITIGLGDRLGRASAGHLRLAKDYGFFPVIAQQSIRELTLTKRNFDLVLMDAGFAVFEEGFKSGFGADGDHLKTPDEVKLAMDAGYTMITLDCSAAIDNSIYELSAEERDAKYAALPQDERAALEAKYLNGITLKDGTSVPIDEALFKQTILVYGEAIKFAADMYLNVIKPYGRPVDYEVSIDETVYTTEPAAHFIVGSELIERGVDIVSVAPRFVGHFEKGIDYKGDLTEFRADFDIQEKICKHFGYKISVHSGSDKFMAFPIVGELTGGRYHLKTSGTNWLECLRMVAANDKALFKKIYNFDKTVFADAQQFYVVGATLDKCPDIDTIAEADYGQLLVADDTRQLMHITYGYVLNQENADGTLAFRPGIYSLLHSHEEDYYDMLYKHIERHVVSLGMKKN